MKIALIAAALLSCSLSFAEESDPLAKAKSLAASGKPDEALALVTSTLEKSPSAEAHLFRAELREAKGEYAKAVEDYNAAMKDQGARPVILQTRGIAKFFARDYVGSVADFDAFLKERPSQAPHHWQRGLALYLAGKFREGREQFELHQTVNGHDVENAAWHFNCVAKQVNLEAARKVLIPIEGDLRVPLAEIQALYAGKGTEAEVIKAAEAGDGERKRNQLCYAYLYLGLYEEALGHDDKARAHFEKAAKDYSMKHYMGETARVLFEERTAKKGP